MGMKLERTKSTRSNLNDNFVGMAKKGLQLFEKKKRNLQRSEEILSGKKNLRQ